MQLPMFLKQLPTFLKPRLVTTRARAHVNHGRWVADCPWAHCNNAVALDPGASTMHCLGGCLAVARVEWPPDPDGIWDALAARPVPATRNWAPAGHRQSVACGFPDGQSAAELRSETAEHTRDEE